MIKINLIPYREEKKKLETRRQIIVAAASMIILILIVGIFHTYMTMTLSSLEKEVATARTELNRLKKITGDLDKYREDKALAEKKLQVITSLEKNRDEAADLLEELAATVPEGDLWFTLLSKRGSDLRIEGMAKDNRAVALLMEKLEASPMIVSLDLIAAKRVPYAETELKNFSLIGKVEQR